MARTKRSSSTSRSTTASSSKPEIYKLVWGTYKGEWKLAYVDITPELATEEDVAPDKEMLMVDPNNPMKFYEVVFHHSMDWDNIVELVKAKRVYKYGNTRTISETEGTQLRATDPGLF
jgi:hypothetical protein